LAGFYVFDGSSLGAHLTRANSLLFAPSALGLLTQLAEVTDEIRSRLRRMIAEREVEHNFGAWFDGWSEVVEKIESLDERTDLLRLSARKA
jgi:hypothetical protein